ncbi:hypothetical protein PR202_gb07214 [Eleusine coracana subsp. coracana]|uniref:Uncharacterized protein n=1 Tax=Eleusine coracana subsp. coracana TaxID=191504 RepID=A0AAV5E9V0_ELECO|nr:hypothetical protein PR202_gb07214 [Eleusine coracana subsp. coracana]
MMAVVTKATADIAALAIDAVHMCHGPLIEIRDGRPFHVPEGVIQCVQFTSLLALDACVLRPILPRPALQSPAMP